MIHPDVVQGRCVTSLALWDMSTVHQRVLFERNANYSGAG